ncbi:uncharacterized protein LOC113789897 [Dermatophagoides pteronyssinus]|uniref:uncharacterized protein LOC113789897 n=1 Tax=Dermatophagoides pteronyssinus TaxID=6956 RepID=UPI003F66A00B
MMNKRNIIVIQIIIIYLFMESIEMFEMRSKFDDPDDPQLIGRFQYHQQGLNGRHPMSYRFGFVADDHQNPLSRHEMSHAPGHVTGAYSYIDANNKWQVVQYEAHPEHGFRIVKQWTKNRD